jgi:hypothetical protein
MPGSRKIQVNRKVSGFRGLVLRAGAVVIGIVIAMNAMAQNPRPLPSPGTASVVLAGDCFWGMQGVFDHLKGVTNTVVGYAGGTKETAHYDMSPNATPGTRRRSRPHGIPRRSPSAICLRSISALRTIRRR